MKNLIRLEEFSIFLLSLFLFSQLSYQWWLFPLLFLLPDLSMAGYMKSPKIGAVLYNIIHHRALSLSILGAGYYLSNELIMLVAIILFAHSTLDRVFDYGLKYSDNFQHTHLS
jgi:hypothetical protein